MSSVALPTGDRSKGQKVKGELVDKPKRKVVKDDTPYADPNVRKQQQARSGAHVHDDHLGSRFDGRDLQLRVQQFGDGVQRAVSGFFDAIGGAVLTAMGQNPQQQQKVATVQGGKKGSTASASGSKK